MNNSLENPKVNPDKVVKILCSEGLDIQKEDAVRLLLLMKKMASIVVRKYLER